MSYQYERVVTPSSGLRLHLNENTAGCSPAVEAALQRLTRRDAAFYPDYNAAIDACAARLGVPAGRVLLTNGLDDGILALSIAALRGSPPDAPFEAVVIVPAFDMYASCADMLGGRVVEIPLGDNFSFPGDAVAAAIGPRTRIIWLTNPHNPTGQVIPRAEIERIASAAPGATVVVDEAYADFSGETLLADDFLDRFRNVIVGRTFAKAYGLAALRAGALVAHPDTLAPLRRIVLPYALNAYAAAALPAALADRAHVEWYLEQARESKALLYETLDRLGVGYWRSAANFVLVRIGADARRVIDALASRDVYVRDKTRDHGCAGCFRVTTGLVADTRAFIAALEEVL